MSIEQFATGYIQSLKRLLDSVDGKVLGEIVAALEATLKTGGRIYVIGNGGSAATASHMANDFGIGLKRRNIRNFDIISLADNVAVNTAISNDIGYENTFFAQLENRISPKDMLIAISCSGNSPNIVKAIEYAVQIGATVVGCSGFDGGRLRELATICFHVDTPKGEYGLVEDMHMILDHLIYSYYLTKAN